MGSASDAEERIAQEVEVHHPIYGPYNDKVLKFLPPSMRDQYMESFTNDCTASQTRSEARIDEEKEKGMIDMLKWAHDRMRLYAVPNAPSYLYREDVDIGAEAEALSGVPRPKWACRPRHMERPCRNEYHAWLCKVASALQSGSKTTEKREKEMKKTVFQTAKSDLETAAYQVAVDEVTDALLAAAVNYASTSLPKSYGRDVALFLSSKLGRGIFQLAIGWLATYMADTEYGEKLNNAKVLRLAEQFRIQGNAQAVSLAAKPLILMAKTHIAPFLLQLPEPRDASDPSG